MNPKSGDLQAWWASHHSAYPPERHDSIKRALQLCQAVTPDLPFRQFTSENHLIQQLNVLSQLRADDEVITAALLFHAWRLGTLAEESGTETLPELTDFSDKVRFLLVELQRVSQLEWLNGAKASSGDAESLRRLLFAMIKDVRLVLILLADQLVLLRAAAGFDEQTRRLLGQATMTLHAPLANRLGVWQVKWELEDLVFRYLEPEKYREIASLLAERRADREAFIAQCTAQLKAKLDEVGITADIAGRPKHIYSIYKKMQRKNLTFEGLYDVRAIRVLTNTVTDCYAVLGFVHSLWKHIPREFDDYIATPKGNMYQSLHTVVIGPQGKTLEVQIRTWEMHEHAELGVAAHWRYKDGSRQDPGFDNKVNWMRQLLAASESGDDNLLEQFQAETEDERIYVFTPGGDVIDLPAGATVVDFAYHVHTEVGHRCRGAKVNGRIVPLTHQLETGDRVEILTGKEAQPSRDWLSEQAGYLKSGRARAKVRHWFRERDFEQNLAAGKDMLEKELKKFALSDVDIKALLPRFNLKHEDKLYAMIATGDVSLNQFLRLAEEQVRPAHKSPLKVTTPPVSEGHRAAGNDRFVVDGLANVLATPAQCCAPIPGDAVGGFITRGRGISVHRADCDNFVRLISEQPGRHIPVRWNSDHSSAIPVTLSITALDRKSFIKDLSAVLANQQANIEYFHTEHDPDSGLNRMQVAIRIRDFDHLSAILNRVSSIEHLLEVHRLA